MRFKWDEAKNRRNLPKHNVRFETAALVFDDPYALTERDESSGEEDRWITFGAIGQEAVLVVVHTYFEEKYEDVTRTISAPAAESREKKTYEEAHQRTKTRHRRHRGDERRRL